MSRDWTERTISALGTEVRLVVFGPDSARLIARAEEEVLDYHARLSRFRADSELCALNADPRERVPASPLLVGAVEAALWAARRSGGLVDPCLLDALERAGYRSSLADRRRRLAVPPPRRSARPARPNPGSAWRQARVEASSIVRPPGLRLDLGGSGKGHVADRLAGVLGGAPRWFVDCGGDIRVGGVQEVHVSHPLDGTVIARLLVADAAVATSSVVSRAWTNPDGTAAHHLLDPETGEPAWTGLLAATALAATTLEAETLAKMALLSGPLKARRVLRRGGGLIVHVDGTVENVRALPQLEQVAA